MQSIHFSKFISDHNIYLEDAGANRFDNMVENLNDDSDGKNHQLKKIQKII